MFIKNKNITYCSNIFKDKKMRELLDTLDSYAIFLRNKLKYKNIALGLCMSNSLIQEFLQKDNFKHLKIWLDTNKLHLSSVNGFVYKSFHNKKIKEYIYYPDWTDYKRVIYTQRIVYFLSNLGSENKNISISTSPLSYKYWSDKKNRKYIFYISTLNILKVLLFLININKNFGFYIHIDIEPEPSCLIESADDFIFFFRHWLMPLSRVFSDDKDKIIFYVRKYINLCYDICHFSVNREKHIVSMKKLIKAGVIIGKIQISSALQISQECDKINEVINDLLFLTKSKFLHQNTSLNIKKEKFVKFTDIPPLLQTDINNFDIRIHCHMPIYLNNYKNIFGTTSLETFNVVILMLKYFNIQHWEIETYTYDMLLRSNKLESILLEYLFILNLIKNV